MVDLGALDAPVPALAAPGQASGAELVADGLFGDPEQLGGRGDADRGGGGQGAGAGGGFGGGQGLDGEHRYARCGGLGAGDREQRGGAEAVGGDGQVEFGPAEGGVARRSQPRSEAVQRSLAGGVSGRELDAGVEVGGGWCTSR